MSTINSNSVRVWSQLTHSLAAWQGRVNARIELNNLDDRLLRDIGLTRGNDRPISRPFWML